MNNYPGIPSSLTSSNENYPNIQEKRVTREFSKVSKSGTLRMFIPSNEKESRIRARSTIKLKMSSVMRLRILRVGPIRRLSCISESTFTHIKLTRVA